MGLDENTRQRLYEILEDAKSKTDNSTEENLITETVRWLGKIKEIEKPSIDNKVEEEAWENVQAYIQDTQYFVEKRDWVRAFEACLWAWAFYEVSFKFGKE